MFLIIALAPLTFCYVPTLNDAIGRSDEESGFVYAFLFPRDLTAFGDRILSICAN